MAKSTDTVVSLDALSVEDAEVTKITRARGGKPNPMRKHFDASTEDGKVKAITVKGSQVAEVEALLRRAAADTDRGVQISYPSRTETYKAKDRATGQEKDATRRVVDAAPTDDVRVVFQSRPKRGSQTAIDAAAPAETAE